MATPVPDIQERIYRAVQANKDHQYALRIYSERVESEIETLNKLLAAADVSDTEEVEDTLEVNNGGTVVIPNSVDFAAPVSSGDLFSEVSPFKTAALQRQRYVEATVTHQWRSQELEALAEAVRSGNKRIFAVEAQNRGYLGFTASNIDATKFMNENKTGIDWELVAAKVTKSSANGVRRSAKQCEIKWLGERHPQLNHSQWTQPEVDRVKSLVANAIPGQVNWVEVAAKLGTGRTPVDCMRHAIYRRVHVWDPDSDERLKRAIDKYGIENWMLVAKAVSEDATAQQCQNRYTRYLNTNIKRVPFTEEEDKILRDAVTVFGNAWQDICQFLPGRTNEQCRERHQELVNPSGPKRKWSDDEDRRLLDTAEQVEMVDWKEVSKAVGGGRTDSQCRARYGVLMKRVRSIAPAPSVTSLAAALATYQHRATFRPILPAPAVVPNPSQCAGSSASHSNPSSSVVAPVRTLENENPIHSSSQTSVPTTGDRLAISAAAPAPPHVSALPSQPSSQSAALLRLVPDPVPQSTPQPLACCERESSQESKQLSVAQPSVSEDVPPTEPQTGANIRCETAPTPRPRPRPRRKRATETSSGEPSTSPTPKRAQVTEEASTTAQSDKGEGKEVTEEGDAEQSMQECARHSTKRLLDAVADNPPSKRRQTRKKALDNSDGPRAEVARSDTPGVTTITLQDARHSPAGPPNSEYDRYTTPPTVIGTSVTGNLGSPVTEPVARTQTQGPATPQTQPAAISSRADSKRGRRSGMPPAPTRQQPIRRSTRSRPQANTADVATALPQGTGTKRGALVRNTPAATNEDKADESSELSSPPSSP